MRIASIFDAEYDWADGKGMIGAYERQVSAVSGHVAWVLADGPAWGGMIPPPWVKPTVISDPAVPRSARPEVYNKFLGLPSARAISDCPADERRALGTLLRQVVIEAKQLAEALWRADPMRAAYWRVVKVYAGHAAAAIDPSSRTGRRPRTVH